MSQLMLLALTVAFATACASTDRKSFLPQPEAEKERKFIVYEPPPQMEEDDTTVFELLEDDEEYATVDSLDGHADKFCVEGEEFDLFAAGDRGENRRSSHSESIDADDLVDDDALAHHAAPPGLEETLVKIEAPYDGAIVLIDGERAGSAGEFLAVPPGKVKLEVRAAGRMPKTVKLKIRPSEHKVVRVRMRPAPAILNEH